MAGGRALVRSQQQKNVGLYEECMCACLAVQVGTQKKQRDALAHMLLRIAIPYGQINSPLLQLLQLPSRCH